MKRDVPKLSNGIGKENNSKKLLVKLTTMKIMRISTMATSSSQLHSEKNIITDLFNGIWLLGAAIQESVYRMRLQLG